MIPLIHSTSVQVSLDGYCYARDIYEAILPYFDNIVGYETDPCNEWDASRLQERIDDLTFYVPCMKELKSDRIDVYNSDKYKMLESKEGNLEAIKDRFTGHSPVKKQLYNWESEVFQDGNRSLLTVFHLNIERNILQTEMFEVFGYQKDSNTFTQDSYITSLGFSEVFVDDMLMNYGGLGSVGIYQDTEKKG